MCVLIIVFACSHLSTNGVQLTRRHTLYRMYKAIILLVFHHRCCTSSLPSFTVTSDISQAGKSQAKRKGDKVLSSVSSSTGKPRETRPFSTCNATIVEHERVGIVSIGMGYTQQGWQCSRFNFNTFSPMLSNGWCLTAFGTRYSLRLIKRLCRERVSRKTCHSPHFTRLVGVCRSADQALGGASSCLMHANRLGARDTSHGAHRTVGAMMHMA